MHLQTSLPGRRFLTTAFVAAAILCASTWGITARQSVTVDAKEQPYAIEYYYKAKWGHAEEFLALFKKNHYPLLKKEMELGRMLKVSMVTPRYHMTENSRWDYRVTIVFKNAATGRIVSVKTYVPTYHGDGRSDWTFAVAITYKDVAAMVAPSGDEEIQRRLYPDRAKFLKEEQRRFEILDAHWDLPIKDVDLDAK